jgi:hypothetical protein
MTRGCFAGAVREYFHCWRVLGTVTGSCESTLFNLVSPLLTACLFLFDLFLVLTTGVSTLYRFESVAFASWSW